MLFMIVYYFICIIFDSPLFLKFYPTLWPWMVLQRRSMRRPPQNWAIQKGNNTSLACSPTSPTPSPDHFWAKVLSLFQIILLANAFPSKIIQRGRTNVIGQSDHRLKLSEDLRNGRSAVCSEGRWQNNKIIHHISKVLLN